MTILPTKLTNLLPPRLNMFVTSVLTFIVIWLATAGLIDTIENGNSWIVFKLCVLVAGSALAAITRPIPCENRKSI
jgi:hypothetical protein